MKLKPFIILFFLIVSLQCVSQYDNDNDVIAPFTATKSTSCIGSSTAYLNRYNLIENYIPSSGDDIKRLKVNIVVMQNNSGGNNFQHDDPNNPLGDLARILDIYEWLCNNKMINMSPSDPIAGVTSLSNPYFEYTLNNVYFYRNSTGNTSSSLSVLSNIVVTTSPYSVYNVNNYDNTPSDLQEINIFFTQAGGPYSFANIPSDSDLDSPVYCVITSAYTQGGWAVSGGVAHELGHNIDLCHTYLGGGCPTTVATMNSSGNWFADLFGSPYPGNAPHITSSCPYSECPPINYAWDVSPYDNTIPMYDRVTNNIMGNQGNSRNYLSPSQIGRAHRAYYLTSVRQFIIDDCYNVNSPIIISSDETWDFNIRVYEDIIIENNAQCDITCHVELPYNAKIIVRNGSTLVVDGSITGVNGEAWRGQIDVEPGGELIIEDDGQIFLGEGGSILIDKSSTDIATLSYNIGGEIILSHNTSTLEIIGNLQIGTNAQFTFSGNGFIKFSNPGVDATYNITAGTGASILFSGTGQSDKVLEVQQNTVHFPQLSSLTFENCKIEMGTSKRMQTDAPYPVTFDNVKVTSSTGTNNSHRSFLFSGQSNVTINGSVFEYGQYGIYGNLTWTNGAPLYITNSTFRYNTQGINIYGKGLHLNNCSVINNTSYGVYCDAMSMTSEFIDCNINYNNYGIYYQGSATAHIDIENTYLQSNTVDGVKTNGGFDLNMECAFVNDNNIGVNVANGTIVKPYTCDLSGNYKTIYLNYGSVVLLDQYNQLQADNNYYALHGYVPVKVPSITATHNRWSSVANQSPVEERIIH